MLTTMDWCLCVMVWLLLSVIKMSSSATVTVKKEKLNWTEANEDCQLINVSQLRSVYNSLTSELNVDEEYWIKDSVEKISVVIKGCLSEINISKSTTIPTNMLSDCFKFCGSQTIGIKGRNCSCLSQPQSYQYDSRCNILCLWENSQCKTSEAFSVFQQAEKKQFGGKQLEECIPLSRDPYKESCTEKFRYICQDEDGKLQEKSDESTWLEAFSKCSRNNTILANFPLQSTEYSQFKRGGNKFWIGIRQYFNPDTKKQEQGLCPGALYFATDNIYPQLLICKEEKAYICMNGGCCYEDTCTLLETATICLVIGSLMMTFCHCYRQKLKNESSPSFYVESMNLSPDTNINTHYSPVPVKMVTKVEKIRENLLKAVPETDIPEDFECAICNEGHTAEVSQLPCDHFFHKGCVLQWFISNSQHTCPICRSCQIPANHLLIITVLPAISARPMRTSQL